MKKRVLTPIALLLCAMMILCACNNGTPTPDTPDTSSVPQTTQRPGVNNWSTDEVFTDVDVVESDLSVFDYEFSARDLNHTFMPASATVLTFSNSHVIINGSGASTLDADHPTTVRITTGGSYILTGQCSHGSVIVDVMKGDKVSLIFKGISLYSSDSPVLYVKSAEEVTITLADGTENRLSDGESYTYVDDGTVLDAALYSKEDLCINGLGKLTVQGSMKHGIVSKDDLTITGGTIEVNAKGVAMEGKDSVRIAGGKLNLIAGSDAIRSDNITEPDRGYVYIKDCTLTAHSDNDGIQAANALIIEGGSINITTAGPATPNDSSKGLKSDSDVVIKGGTVNVVSGEDAVNAKKSVVIAGGTLTLDATDEAIDADGDVIVRDGTITVTNANKAIKAQDVVIAGGTTSLLANGDGINAIGEATAEINAGNILVSGGYLWVSAKKDCLDANTSIFITGGVTLIDAESTDKNVTLNANVSILISGGVLVATGSQDTVKSVTGATNQGVMRIYFEAQEAGTPIVVCDPFGTVLASFTPTKKYTAAMISTPEMQCRTAYSIYCGGTLMDADANGFSTNVAYTPGTSLGSVTFTSNVYK